MAVTVLVADNDAGVRSLLAEVVRRSGCAVVEADNGVDAVALVEQRPVDILVCDLDMPGVAGEEVVARVAARSAPPAIVVVSGFLDAATVEALQAQACVRAVLRKPFDVLMFADLIGRLVAAASVAPPPERS